MESDRSVTAVRELNWKRYVCVCECECEPFAILQLKRHVHVQRVSVRRLCERDVSSIRSVSRRALSIVRSL